MHIVEQFSTPRSQDRQNEDLYVLTPEYVAVIDGAGDPLRRTWRGHSLGRLAAETVKSAVTSLNPDASAVDAVAEMTAALRRLVTQLATDGFQPPHPAANIVVYAKRQRAVWRVGDCKFRIDQREYQPRRKPFEQLLIDVRRLILLAGRSEDDRQEDLDADVGRVYDVLYHYQEKCQNSPRRHAFSFPVLDGRSIDPSDIELVPVPEGAHELVLASDGYPVLLATLDDTEKELAKILAADPLLVGEHAQSTASSGSGTSFDDRTYLRIAL